MTPPDPPKDPPVDLPIVDYDVALAKFEAALTADENDEAESGWMAEEVKDRSRGSET